MIAAVTDMTAAGSTTTTPGTSIRSLAFVAPVVLTGGATETTSSKATLSGLVNPADQETTYHFQYGTSKHYGKTTKTGTIAAGTTAHGVTVAIKGLKAGTTYHFRVIAANASGTGAGRDATFKTTRAQKHKTARRA